MFPLLSVVFDWISFILSSNKNKMSSNFCQIRLLTKVLAALEHLNHHGLHFARLLLIQSFSKLEVRYV